MCTLIIHFGWSKDESYAEIKFNIFFLNLQKGAFLATRNRAAVTFATNFAQSIKERLKSMDYIFNS